MKNISQESLQLLVNTVQELSLARDLNTVMLIVRSVARKLTGADGATFVLRDGNLCYYADEESISPLWKGSRFPMETCISGWAMLNKRPVVIEDIYKDNRIPAAAYKPTFVKSLAMIPIRTMDPIGAIGNYWAEQHEPSEGEIWLLQSLADITAVTMENVQVYNELEERVKERTLQLEVMNKELEAFSYTVSHDLRAPLRAIRQYMNMMKNGSMDEQSLQIAGKVINNASNMDNLIENLLNFFKTGKTEPNKYPISVDALVADIVSSTKEQEKKRNIHFNIAALPLAAADPFLIKQVWVNLISNAVKYTRLKEEAVIEIGYQNLEKEQVFFVKDNGAGFDMRFYNKLFGVFQRLHTDHEFEGNGIGLATVQSIVGRHGGRVWADGEPGTGATFYFSLPRQEESNLYLHQKKKPVPAMEK